jgi:hypothetical protein
MENNVLLSESILNESTLNKLMFLEDKILAYLEFLDIQIRDISVNVKLFIETDIFNDFLVYFNYKKFINSGISNFKKNLDSFAELKHINYEMSFKTINNIGIKFKTFFTNNDIYYFFNKNLHDSFILYYFKKIDKISDVKTIKTILYDEDFKKVIKSLQQLVNDIHGELMMDNYGCKGIFNSLEALNNTYQSIEIPNSDIILKIIEEFTDYNINDCNITNINFLEKLYQDIYQKTSIKNYIVGNVTLENKKKNFIEKEVDLNKNLNIHQLEIFNLEKLKKKIESLEEEIKQKNKERKIILFGNSSEIKNNNNKLSEIDIELKKINGKNEEFIENLNNKISENELLISEMNKNINIESLEHELEWINEKLTHYPTKDKYLKKKEELTVQINNIIENNNFKIKMIKNKIKELDNERTSLIADNIKIVSEISNQRDKIEDESKSINTDKEDLIIKMLISEKEYLEQEKIIKEEYIKNKADSNYKLKRKRNQVYREFHKYQNFVIKKSDEIFKEYQVAIENKLYVENYINQIKDQQRIKKKIDEKIRLCLCTNFYMEYEKSFLSKCKELYSQKNFNKLIYKKFSNFSPDFKYLIDIISKQHIYHFYSHLIYNLCKVLPDTYSKNIKIFINRNINKILKDRSYDFNLKNFQKIVTQYQGIEEVQINNQNIDELDKYVKKRNRAYKYLDNLKKHRDELVILDTL